MKYHFISALFLSLVVNTSFANDFSNVYKEYQDAYENEDFILALPLALQSYELGIEKFGKDSENALNLALNLADAHKQNKQYKEAIVIYSDIEDKYLSMFEEQSPQTLDFRLKQIVVEGHDFSSSNGISRFKKHTKNAVKLTQLLSTQSPDKAALYKYETIQAIKEAGVLGISGKKAIKLAQDAERTMIDALGQKDIRVAQVQFYLAHLLNRYGNTKQAIEEFENVVATYNEAAPYTHPYELASHANLVKLYEAKNESEKSTEHCVAIGRMTPWNDDIEPVPLYREDPKYPTQAARSNKEGSVVITFNITPFGFVENPRITETQGGSTFNKSALEAVSSWRYAPKFEDGNAVLAKNRTVQLDFRLSQ